MVVRMWVKNKERAVMKRDVEFVIQDSTSYIIEFEEGRREYIDRANIEMFEVMKKEEWFTLDQVLTRHFGYRKFIDNVNGWLWEVTPLDDEFKKFTLVFKGKDENSKLNGNYLIENYPIENIIQLSDLIKFKFKKA